jgi:pimeloyl-ACP methyl ester carboxylesterase/uncharacterized protein YlxP (DUF503 family)
VNNADNITTASTFGQIFNVNPASSYRVDRLNSDGNEGHRHTFKIFRTGNTAVAGQVRFSTSADSATSDVDFSSYTAVRNFAAGQTEDTVYVDSRTDNVNEGTERFNVSISKVNNADNITTASTFGQIFNVNPASSYRVDRLNSDGTEGSKHTFKIFRTGNTAVAGQVRFSTSSDSATTDVDFSPYSAVRNFAPGQTEDVVYVDSRTDKIGEATERFNVSISKVNTADTITVASTFGQIFNVNPPSGTTYVTPMGKTLAGKDAYVVFQRVDGPGFIEDKETWLIFHGWNGKTDDFADLGRAIEQYDGIRGGGDYQVILVDWNAARNESLVNASLMIDSVAQAVKNTLTLWGIQNSKINLAGHSLGAYVSYELSKRLGSVNKLVAMNPASITLGGYNVGGVDFKRYSNWSWAFWQNNLTDSGEATLTADESFIISLPWYNPGSSNPNAGHGSAKLVWTNWLRNKNGALSAWFGLEDIRLRSAPWNIGWGWEAEVEANSSFIATGKYWEA